jgi:hypothetical protein
MKLLFVVFGLCAAIPTLPYRTGAVLENAIIDAATGKAQRRFVNNIEHLQLALGTSGTGTDFESKIAKIHLRLIRIRKSNHSYLHPIVFTII